MGRVKPVSSRKLKAYDQGFADFFKNLGENGINPGNTLFVVTTDEGDHFVGAAPSPADCDGVTTPCTYSQLGEIDTEYPHFLDSTLPSGYGFHSDSAPVTWVTGNPAADDSAVRLAEQTLAASTATNPYTGDTDDLFVAFADSPELTALHQASLGDPARIPTFIPFGDDNYFFESDACPTEPPYVCIGPDFAWNHGDIQQQIANVWVGFAGPGVQRQGENDWLWVDHTDVRPTMLTLLGLKDDYVHDGRLLAEVLPNSALPPAIRPAASPFAALAEVYKQINAPFGSFGNTTLLGLATPGIAGTDDAVYVDNENTISILTARRDALAAQIRTLLDNSEFGGQPFNVSLSIRYTLQAYALLADLYSYTGGDIPLLP
jgi:arylsulfatase A-like enzyme